MVQIKIEQSVAGQSFSYQPGDMPLLEDELASAWVESGIASRIPVIEPVVVVPVKEFAVAAKADKAEKATAV